MKPLIGITTGEIVNKDRPWASSAYGQKRSYSEAIVAGGGVPVLIPLIPENELRQLYTRLDGILFAGGNDIDPALYSEAPHPLTIEISSKRDSVEALLMQWALEDDKPVLAICRGFQFLNVHLGGSLYQDIDAHVEGASDHAVSTKMKDYTHIAHHLKVEPNSLLTALTHSEELKANSHHHQAIKNLGRDLRPTAWSEDGLIEAIEHPKRQFVLGVQCHPESLYEIDETWAALFQSFIQAASNRTVPSRLLVLRKRLNTKLFPKR